MLDYSKNVVYFGYDYRKKYEEQVNSKGMISIRYSLPEPGTIACFLGVAALSGIIGGASYDIVKEVIRRIISGSKKNTHDKSKARIQIFNETDVNIFFQYIQEYHTDKMATNDDVKQEITKEKFISHLANATAPALMKGKLTPEKIHDALKKAAKTYQNIEKPNPQDFSSFWKNMNDV
jgi:hypothetical protein